MGYLASARGDYMRGRGDPGLFSFIGKAVKSVARIGTSFLPGPAGQMARAIVGGGGRRPPQQQQMFPGGIPLRQPFAAPRSFGGGGMSAAAGPGGRRRKRMNVGNVRALRRAMRRQEGFVKLARRALKGSKYRIVTASSRAPSRVSITERGPGGISVRR